MPTNRQLTPNEYALLHWMLTHSTPEALTFLPQLQLAEVTPWRCKCGCASLNFKIKDRPEAPPCVHPIADFYFGPKESPDGIFIFESAGILSGVEVYGMSGDVPNVLPPPESLWR